MRLTRFICNYDDPASIGSRLRRARGRRLVALIAKIVRARGHCRVVDLGGTVSYWNNLANESSTRGVLDSVMLVNRNPVFVKAASAHGYSGIAGDACSVGFDDNSFDLVHSNSTIEHVGDWRRMSRFAGEVRRLAPYYFVQTPNFWFPWEPHFGAPLWQFLPEPIRVSLVLRRSWGHYIRAPDVDAAVRTVQDAQLLDRRMFASLFPDAAIEVERLFGLPKSLLAIRG